MLQTRACPEMHAGWLGFCLGSAWPRKLQKHVVRDRKLQQKRGNTLQSTTPCKYFLCTASFCYTAEAATNRQVVGRKGAMDEIPLCSRLALWNESGIRHPINAAPAKIPSKIIPCLACWGNNSAWNLFWAGKSVAKMIWLKIDLGSTAPPGKILSFISCCGPWILLP